MDYTQTQETRQQPPRLLIIGWAQEYHVGAHFQRAAESMGWQSRVIDLQGAYAAPRIVKALLWRLDRRPLRFRVFEQQVLVACTRERPTHLLATGLAPLRRNILREIERNGIVTMNYLTDDPWNPQNRSGWFEAALTEYQNIFTTRRSNLDDLSKHGCRVVHYLPFAYCPEVHYIESPPSGYPTDADVLFVGGEDGDRVPYVRALIDAGLKVALYGGTWNRIIGMGSSWHGHADLPTQRLLTGAVKMVLCLVRRANRDGHCMRSYEVPAMGGCLLAEDTDEHREIFGAEGECVVYFKTTGEMVERARWLVDHPEECKRLADAAHRRITSGGNTYADRLERMMALTPLGKSKFTP